jgi:peptidoglycan/xylan/chitin deacetylase (PgdA/CDA1 family)
VDIRPLTDEHATKPKIDQLMTDVVPGVVTSRDRFLFYWSGHGDQRVIGGRPSGFLPLAASKSKGEFFNMISMQDIARWDGYLDTQQALFVLDSCLSGLAGVEKKSLQDELFAQLAKPAHHLLTAGTADEIAIAGERWTGSLFTDSFILGARGEARRQSSNIVSLFSLIDFIRERVVFEKQAVNWSKSLTPQLRDLRGSDGTFFFTPPRMENVTSTVPRIEGSVQKKGDIEPPAFAPQTPNPTAVLEETRNSDEFWREPKPQARLSPAPQATVPQLSAGTCAGNPNAIGISRTVQIDTTGGPGFGFEHFKTHDFLREGEVVLTFDDGPWPRNTPAVLSALSAHCTKAIFFPIGLHATYEPGILKQVAAAGHVIGSHTWCHSDLSKTKGQCYVNGKLQGYEYDPKEEIEKGISAVRWAVGGPTAPFFRFPALRQPPQLVQYLGERNIAIFSTDIDSLDFKLRSPNEVVQTVLERLKMKGKGIVLLHDFQNTTAEAALTLLNQLKANDYKIVEVRSRDAVRTLAQYDAQIRTITARP